MKKYEIIDHPSDIGIIARGRTKKEAFENAAFGMMDMMFDLSKVKPKETIKIKVEGEDIQSLLVNWLNELIYLSDAKRIMFSSYEILSFGDKMLEALVAGEKIGTAKHKVKLYIKAATYNQIDIVKIKSGYSIKIIFDV